MSNMPTTKQCTVSSAGVEQDSDEPRWLQDVREQGQDQYPELEIPNWKGTRLRHRKLRELELDDKKFPVSVPSVEPDEELFQESTLSSREGSGVFYSQLGESGRQGCWLDPDLKEKGVVFGTFPEVVREHPSLVEDYFGELVPLEEDHDHSEANKFLAMNQALFQSGAVLYVPEGLTIDEPFYLESFRGPSVTGQSDRILVIGEDRSRFSVVENIRSQADEETDQYLRTHVTEVFVGDRANVQFASVQDLDTKTFNTSIRKVTVGDDSEFQWVFGDMGGRFNLNYNHSVANGKGSTAKLRGIFFGSEEQRFRFSNFMIHKGEHSNTDMVANGVLTDSCRLVYLGLARIIEGASGSNAHQSEKSLIIGEDARNDAIPELEIDEDDVIAEHAATVGELDQSQIFYLMSRGLTRQGAEKMIIEGALTPVIEEIEEDIIREQLVQLVRDKMDEHYQ